MGIEDFKIDSEEVLIDRGHHIQLICDKLCGGPCCVYRMKFIKC
jgi:hypothetical protein